MVKSALCKLLQKQTYSVLSHKHGFWICLLAIVLLVVSAFQFGEVTMEWSKEKYAAVFNSFSDNVAGRSYQSRLCLPVPIDVVYTWVNGSDPSVLVGLGKVKAQLQMELNQTRTPAPKSNSSGPADCTFTHCIAVNLVVLEPPMPPDLSIASLGILYPTFKKAVKVRLLKSATDESLNVTVVEFSNKEDVAAALKEQVVVNGRNVSIKQGYLSTDWTIHNSILLHDTAIMSGFPHSYKEPEKLLAKLPDKQQAMISQVKIFEEKGLAVFTIPKKEDFEFFLQDSNITFDGKEPTLNPANLLWDLTEDIRNEDIAASRFEDNEELRYSLRSVERFAPWVRHIYIVTNGQIPSWLNLDHPRLSIITHQEIFPNKSHLPTFSSPAIESHLHRIPGLSDKFIYMNDDVMFGKEVWPDDFFTHAHGQKVYLTWPVPNCQDGCPSTWIKDGYCDKACNNTECEWDGGDCEAGVDNRNYALAGRDGGQAGPYWQHHAGISEELYCHSGCANNWIADRYCDQACNVAECGFDAGDCGSSKFHLMHRVDVSRDQKNYVLPKGETVAFFNLTAIFGADGHVEEGQFEEYPIIRTATFAQKFKTMHLVLQNNHTLTVLNFTITGKDNNNNKTKFSFNVTVDTYRDKKDVVNTTQAGVVESLSSSKGNITENKGNKTKPQFVFQDIPTERRAPKDNSSVDNHSLYKPLNLSAMHLPENLQKGFDLLEKQLKSGDLTEKGFNLRKNILWNKYQIEQASQGAAHDAPRTGNLPIVDSAERKPQAPNLQGYLKNKKFGGSKDVGKDEGHVQGKEGQTQGHAQGQIPLSQGQGHSQFGQGRLKVDQGQSKGNQQVRFNQGQVKISQGQRDDRGRTLVDEGHKADGEKNKVASKQRKDEETKAEEGKKEKKGFHSRTLKSVQSNLMSGFLPWEKRGVFKELMEKKDALIRKMQYETGHQPNRKLLDTFGDSLRHVNKIYNREFGYTARKVPAHMAHMIDRHVMNELQERFPEEWDATSSHKVRSSNDMQFAFAFFYYLMGVPSNMSVPRVFDDMDTDHSGVLSDREIRTLATRLYELPLDLQTLTNLEKMMIDCSTNSSVEAEIIPESLREKYYEKDMPQVTKSLVVSCKPLSDLIISKFRGGTKYKFETVGEEEVTFKMIKTNVSSVVGQLDDIRRHPKKFICLNDNIEHEKEAAQTVKAVLQDFYEGLFPIASSFELQREYRNRFLNMEELREWRNYRDWLKMWTHLALFLLIVFTIASFFADKIEALQRRLFHRRPAATSEKEAEKKEEFVSQSRSSVVETV